MPIGTAAGVDPFWLGCENSLNAVLIKQISKPLVCGWDLYLCRCRRLQPVMVASTFSRCHCRGPLPWVQPQRR